MQAHHEGVADGGRDDTRPWTPAQARTHGHDNGSRSGSGLPRAMAAGLPADSPDSTPRDRTRLAAMPPWACAPGSEDEFRLCEDPSCAQVPRPPSECDCPVNRPFSDEAPVTAWFKSLAWSDGRHRPRCGCTETRAAAATVGQPYCCIGCRETFSVRIGTALDRSKATFRQWFFAIHLELTSLKGVSSMKLHWNIIESVLITGASPMVLLNSNKATIVAEPEMVDATQTEPLTIPLSGRNTHGLILHLTRWTTGPMAVLLGRY